MVWERPMKHEVFFVFVDKDGTKSLKTLSVEAFEFADAVLKSNTILSICAEIEECREWWIEGVFLTREEENSSEWNRD